MLHHGNKKKSPISPLCRAVRLLGREKKGKTAHRYKREEKGEMVAVLLVDEFCNIIFLLRIL
jgi:hypothetical protein